MKFGMRRGQQNGPDFAPGRPDGAAGRGFSKGVESKTDEELLRLALERDQLTADANLALSSELSRRGLNSEEKLREFRAGGESRRKALDRDIGRLFLTWNGFGRSRFWKCERRAASDAGLEEFTTTVFVVVLWVPLVPIGTFRVRGRTGFFSGPVHVLERLPLNWAQVVKVWAATLSIFFALAIALRAIPLLLR
jgi:hypothetical protein